MQSCKYLVACLPSNTFGGSILPCVFVAMLGMTTHSENLTRVQQELWYLINDEYVKQVLEAIINKMKEIGDGSERLRQWREEARDYIPDDTKYDENYWVAAYILYSNNSTFVNLYEQLDNIKSSINNLKKDLNKLNKVGKKIWKRMQELYNKIRPFQDQIESLEEQLESIDEACYVISNNLYDLEHELKRTLEDLRITAKQIIM
jgi:chromosome segregation ATPase